MPMGRPAAGFGTRARPAHATSERVVLLALILLLVFTVFLSLR
jgi:hypothetical protein